MIALVLTTLLSQYTPAEAQAVFREANEAYYAQDYATAKAKYLKLVEAGQGGADVLFNLGTACLSLKELGPAVLYLERAKRISSDEDIEGQLALARSLQLDKVVGAEGEVPFTQRVAAAMDVQLVGLGFLAALYAAFALFALARRIEKHSLLVGVTSAALFVVAFALGGAVGIHAYVSRTVKEGVVMIESTKAREFPSETARTPFEVHAGLRIRLMEQSGAYTRIRLPNALEGWVETKALEPL